MDLDLCCRSGSLRNKPGGLREYEVPAEETNYLRRHCCETHQGTCQGQVDFCLEKAVGVGDWQHMAIGLVNAAPLAVSASFWSSNPAGAYPQPLQVISEHSRNMQEQISRFKRSPVHLLSTQMTGKKKSLWLWLHRLSQHPNKFKSWCITEPFEGKFSSWEERMIPMLQPSLGSQSPVMATAWCVAGQKEVWGQDGSLMKLVDLFHLDESVSFTFWMS